MPNYFESNGSRLYFTLDGSGPPVVLLHCLPMDHRIWFNQIFEFSPFYKMVAMDFRGLGLSDKRINDCSITMLARDVSNLMNHLSINRATIVGISLGGAVAQQFAVDFPDRTAALVVSGSGYTSQTEVVQTKFEGRIAGYNSPEAASYYETHLKSLFSEEFLLSTTAKAVISNYMSLKDRLEFRSIANLFKALKKFDLESKIGTVRAPCMVISGDRDRAFNDSKLITERVPNSEFMSVEGSGHAVCIERPREFNAALGQFLRAKLKI